MFIKPISLSATYPFVSRILHLVASRKISKVFTHRKCRRNPGYGGGGGGRCGTSL